MQACRKAGQGGEADVLEVELLERQVKLEVERLERWKQLEMEVLESQVRDK